MALSQAASMMRAATGAFFRESIIMPTKNISFFHYLTRHRVQCIAFRDRLTLVAALDVWCMALPQGASMMRGATRAFSRESIIIPKNTHHFSLSHKTPRAVNCISGPTHNPRCLRRSVSPSPGASGVGEGKFSHCTRRSHFDCFFFTSFNAVPPLGQEWTVPVGCWFPTAQYVCVPKTYFNRVRYFAAHQIEHLVNVPQQKQHHVPRWKLTLTYEY